MRLPARGCSPHLVRPTPRSAERSGDSSEPGEGDVDVQIYLRGALLSSMVAILFSAFLGVGAQQPGAQPAGAGRGRGPAGPPEPTPRLADGTPNLGRVAGEKGVWNVPYITNMGERIVEGDGTTVVERRLASGRGGRGARGESGGPPLGGGEGTSGGARGGARSEPQVPFMPWSAADGDALPDGDRPAARAEAHPDDLRRRDAYLARDLYGREAAPAGRRVESDLPRSFGRSLGGRHAGRGHRRLQRADLDRLLRPPSHRHAPRGREVFPAEQERVALRSHIRGSRRVHQAVHGPLEYQLESNRRAHRIHLPGEQQLPSAADRRLRPADFWEETIGNFTFQFLTILKSPF